MVWLEISDLRYSIQRVTISTCANETISELKLIRCGSLRIGTGDPSDMLNTRTKGSKPIIPEAARFIEVSTNSITLHLSAWSDGGCPMLYFVVEHKKK